MLEATTAGVKIVGPNGGKEGFLGSIGVRFMIDGSEADERFSLVEHPMSARALAAPLHLHTREDEYSFVLEGRMGALLGDGVVEAGPGDLVFKPRNQWHTFWNAGDEPCRILEIISPAGFERFFQELSDLGGALKVGLVTVVFAFLFVDLFDNTGTLIALAHRGGFMRPDGTVPRLNRALIRGLSEGVDKTNGLRRRCLNARAEG